MYLNEDFAPYYGAVLFDNQWQPFVEKCTHISSDMSTDQICQQVGLNSTLYTQVIHVAKNYWKESTSKSLLHGVAYLSPGTVPTVGNAIFPDLMWQTRFLLMCKQERLVGFTNPVREKDSFKTIKVKGEVARTVAQSDVKRVNDIIRCIYLYWYLMQQKPVKLPKTIYRGIRASDLYNHPTFEPVVAAIWKSDKSYAMKKKEALDLLIRWICDKKLHQITDGNILSFTSSKNIAEYFANKSGFVLQVDPRKVEILTSELHDDSFAGPDLVSGKNEKEYIVRIPENYDFKPSDIFIENMDYYIAEQNPLCVKLFDHDDKQATYELDGRPITARFRWKTDQSGRLEFSITDDHFSYSRTEFKKIYNIDPLPQPNNLSKISNFEIKPVKRLW